MIQRLEAGISKLQATPPPLVDLEPLHAENRRLADKKALEDELNRLRAASRELPALRAQAAELKQKGEILPKQADAEDEASLTDDEKLLRRLKEKGLYSFAQEDLPTLTRILKDPALFPKIGHFLRTISHARWKFGEPCSPRAL